MKKGLVWLLSALLTTACGGGAEAPAETESAPAAPVTQEAGGDVLIACFTWADNAAVTNEEEALAAALAHYESVGDSRSSEVDAVATASILAPGNAARIAEWIQAYTGGDLFSIQVEEAYPSDYDDCMERASEEKAENARPALATHVENMDAYDTVFLGFPNWWSDMPMAIHTFVEEYDFSGKTVIPFVTHGTGGIARCVQDLEEALPDTATLLAPIGVYRAETLSAEADVQAWLDGLGIDFTAEAGTNDVTEGETAMTENRTIRLRFESGEMLVELAENTAADALLEQLPMTMEFEDFNGTEKIAYPESGLDVSDAPNSCTPTAGDLTYYIPWGNLAFFYRDFRESPQLVPLGTVTEGLEYLEQLDTLGEVTLESAEG